MFIPQMVSVGVVALVLAVMHYGLLPAVFLGTLLFSGMRWTENALQGRVNHGRTIGMVGVICLLFAGLGMLVAVGGKLMGPEGLAGLLFKLSTIVDQIRHLLPESAREYLPEGLDQLKSVLATQLKGHAQSLTQASMHGFHIIAQLLLATIVAAMLGASFPANPTALVSSALHTHLTNFQKSLVKVFLAQFKVAAINGVVTGIFLVAVLPMFGVHVPFAWVATFLTFVLGLIPVVGNLISNTLNVLLGLSVSPAVGVVCLTFLVVSHKLEYLLSARFVGDGVGAKAWELLTAMVLLEAVYGPIGFAAAPVLYAWIKLELRDRQLI